MSAVKSAATWDNKILKIIAVLTAIGSIIGGVNGFFLKQIEAKDEALKSAQEAATRALNLQIDQFQEVRNERGFSIDHFFKIYDLAAVANDPIQIKLLSQLISSTLDLDIPMERDFRLAYQKMLADRMSSLAQERPHDAAVQKLANQVSDSVKDTASFIEDDNSINDTPVPGAGREFGTYRYDVFECESSGAQGHSLAEKIIDALKQKSAAVRLRTLPDSINASPGYRRSGFLVMIDPGSEEELKFGADIASIATTATGNTFNVRSTSGRNPTPNYISLFVCPNSGY